MSVETFIYSGVDTSVVREGVDNLLLKPQTRLLPGFEKDTDSLLRSRVAPVTVDPELELLGEKHDENTIDESAAANHTRQTAPVLTGDAVDILGDTVVPQRAVYGRILSQHITGCPQMPVSPKLYINSNAPFSALVCGVQGSGKSHTTSVLLESSLIADHRIGTLPAPLSGLVFHFDTAAGGGHVQPCEAAYLATLDPRRAAGSQAPQVVVLVLPGDLVKMQRVYAGLPGVEVKPLHFAPEDISGDRLLAMMKVDEGSQMPLYMESIMAILRSMDDFNYNTFRARLQEESFNPSQKAMLNLRLSLLDSCLKGGTSNNRVANCLKPGTLTIIDLSSQFMDGASACGFFDIILGLFVEVDIPSGKLVVLDEAHKYLTDTGSSSRLTESLLTVIRQQRHLNTRIVISTQEPTVVPSKFLDLCSLIIAHRFSSPKWLKHLTEHISSADTSAQDLFSKIVNLQTGQAVVFAPAGLGVRTNGLGNVQPGSQASSNSIITQIGQGYLLARSRQRITLDGGHSLLAVQDPDSVTRIGRGTTTFTRNTKTSDATDVHNLTASPASRSDITCVETATQQECVVMEGINPSSQVQLPTASFPTKGSSDLSSSTSSCPSVTMPVVPARSFTAKISPQARSIVTVLQYEHLAGNNSISWTTLGAELQKRGMPYTGRLKTHIHDACQADLIQVSDKNQSVRLTSKGAEGAQYRALVALLKGKKGGFLIGSLSCLQPMTIPSGNGQVKKYVKAAVEAGLVSLKDGIVKLLPGIE